MTRNINEYLNSLDPTTRKQIEARAQEIGDFEAFNIGHKTPSEAPTGTLEQIEPDHLGEVDAKENQGPAWVSVCQQDIWDCPDWCENPAHQGPKR